jgi:hypothetical protein
MILNMFRKHVITDIYKRNIPYELTKIISEMIKYFTIEFIKNKNSIPPSISQLQFIPN